MFIYGSMAFYFTHDQIVAECDINIVPTCIFEWFAIDVHSNIDP